MMVPTVDTVRYGFLTSKLVRNNHPVLLVGPVGTGKTSVAINVCDKLDSKSYNILTVNMSAQVRGMGGEILEGRREREGFGRLVKEREKRGEGGSRTKKEMKNGGMGAEERRRLMCGEDKNGEKTKMLINDRIKKLEDEEMNRSIKI